jgi:hypothetical protein
LDVLHGEKKWFIAENFNIFGHKKPGLKPILMHNPLPPHPPIHAFLISPDFGFRCYHSVSLTSLSSRPFLPSPFPLICSVMDPDSLNPSDDEKLKKLQLKFVFLVLTKKCNLLSKLQEKPSALKRKHPALQKCKIQMIPFF